MAIVQSGGTLPGIDLVCGTTFATLNNAADTLYDFSVDDLATDAPSHNPYAILDSEVLQGKPAPIRKAVSHYLKKAIMRKQ